ncbi:class I SAM-dependent methyltransferase [Thermodesulfobacteriota bacterium]
MDDKEKRWSKAQIKEDEFWQRDNVLDDQMDRVVTRYKPVIDNLAGKLPDNPVILDVGCGPTCATRLFPSGLKIFLDPLMDSYGKTYSGTLPEGAKLTCTAETIALSDDSADIVFCVNALDHMIYPGKALSEIKRVLKADGTFVLGLFLHPPPIAWIRRFIDKYLPMFREDAHPYSYTVKSTKKMLGEFFLIKDEVSVYRKETALFPSLHREDRLFLCGKRKSDSS